MRFGDGAFKQVADEAYLQRREANQYVLHQLITSKGHLPFSPLHSCNPEVNLMRWMSLQNCFHQSAFYRQLC